MNNNVACLATQATKGKILWQIHNQRSPCHEEHSSVFDSLSWHKSPMAVDLERLCPVRPRSGGSRHLIAFWRQLELVLSSEKTVVRHNSCKLSSASLPGTLTSFLVCFNLSSSNLNLSIVIAAVLRSSSPAVRRTRRH